MAHETDRSARRTGSPRRVHPANRERLVAVDHRQRPERPLTCPPPDGFRPKAVARNTPACGDCLGTVYTARRSRNASASERAAGCAGRDALTQARTTFNDVAFPPLQGALTVV